MRSVFLLTVVIMLLILAMALWGCGGETQPVTEEEKITPPSLIPGLSMDQSRVVEEFGYPDHFFISFDPYSADRIERWLFFPEGKALDFENGRRSGEEAVEDEAAEYPPTSLHPQDFSQLMTPEEAAQMLGKPLYSHQATDSLTNQDNNIVVFESAILLYRNGQLIGVDTKVKPPQIPSPQ